MDKILKIFNGAFGYVYYYRIRLFKALCLPLAILASLSGIGIYLEMPAFAGFILSLLYYFTYTLIAITTHRIILLGENSVPEWGVTRITQREIRFFIYFLVIGLIFMPFSMFVFIPVIGWLVVILSAIYFLGRLSLVFPAIATDQSWGFRESWVRTKDHQLMMATAVGVLPVFISLPELLLSSLPYADIPIAIISSFTTIVVVAALSVAFKVVLNEEH